MDALNVPPGARPLSHARIATIPRLRCLAAPRLESFGQAIELGPRQDADPVRLLLRVVAAGPGGIPAERLRTSLWPAESARQGRQRMADSIRCLALLVGTGVPPVTIRDGIVSTDTAGLEVDSLTLEERIAPLLDPFRAPSPAEAAEARTAVSQAVAACSAFLPGFDAPWAEAARRRIADSIARAARRLSSAEACVNPIAPLPDAAAAPAAPLSLEPALQGEPRP